MKDLKVIVSRFVAQRKGNVNVVDTYTLDEKAKAKFFNLTMKNQTTVGKKKMIEVPLDLLEVDEKYQRNASLSYEKVNALFNGFEENEMDPIKVSAHTETNTYAIIDGTHRAIVYSLKGETTIPAVIMNDMPNDPVKRQIEEARLFATQNDRTEHVSPAQKHFANILLGVKANIVLEECIKDRNLFRSLKEKYNLPKEERALKGDWKVITGFNAALNVAGLSKGKEILNNILNIIERTMLCENNIGYGAEIIKALKSVLLFHNNSDEVVKALIEYFNYTDVRIFLASAEAEYKGRKEVERNALYLEREVCKILNQEPLYVGGDMRHVTSRYNRTNGLNTNSKITPIAN